MDLAPPLTVPNKLLGIKIQVKIEILDDNPKLQNNPTDTASIAGSDAVQSRM